MNLATYSTEDLLKLSDQLFWTAQTLHEHFNAKEMTLYGGFLLLVQTEIKREMVERGKAA